jgi:nucleotide-binding universal stress UspA family protein
MRARHHARLMGAISGGVTLAAIKRATIPVLMSQ